MQTNISPEYRDTPLGREADAILRACVHCGFCTATCPTYQMLGDELDGPRGRIYQIKALLEDEPASTATRLHLDRCLLCRSCETTCPSGVRYGRLLEIGRELINEQYPRRGLEALKRRLLRAVLPYPGRFSALLFVAWRLRPLLPSNWRRWLPERQQPGDWPQGRHPRRMLVLDGCVQPAATPATNAAAARVLDRLGIRLESVPGAGCCGAVDHHLEASDVARRRARANIDAWWPHIEQGAEAIVATASGCGAMLKDYGELLGNDPAYADKARCIAEKVRDLSEIIAAEPLPSTQRPGRVALHNPCTLQHGQNLHGLIENILEQVGFELVPVADAHLCCGSAGTYSLLQPGLSRRLRDAKLAALQAGGPERIVTANVGCQLHLASASRTPVRHWIELLDEALNP